MAAQGPGNPVSIIFEQKSDYSRPGGAPILAGTGLNCNLAMKGGLRSTKFDKLL